MPLFKKSSDKKLVLLDEKSAPLEEVIQTMTEKNLEAIFGLKFVQTEFPVENLYIDTLAFDAESKSFVIIEYKKDRSFSVIDQGFAYLSLMLRNKAEFILELQKADGKTYDKKDIDWTQSRVIFVSPQFTQHQQLAIGFKDLPIELWKVEFYQGDLVLYSQIEAPGASGSIKAISKKNVTVQQVSQEVKKYTLEDHMRSATSEIRQLFEELRQNILSWDSTIRERIGKWGVSYHIGKGWIAFVYFSKFTNHIDGIVRLDKAPQEITGVVENREIVKYNPLRVRIKIKNPNNLQPALYVLKKAYHQVKTGKAKVFKARR